MKDDRPTFGLDDESPDGDDSPAYIVEHGGDAGFVHSIRNAIIIAVAFAALAGLILGGAKWLDRHGVLDAVRVTFGPERLD